MWDLSPARDLAPKNFLPASRAYFPQSPPPFFFLIQNQDSTRYEIEPGPRGEMHPLISLTTPSIGPISLPFLIHPSFLRLYPKRSFPHFHSFPLLHTHRSPAGGYKSNTFTPSFKTTKFRFFIFPFPLQKPLPTLPPKTPKPQPSPKKKTPPPEAHPINQSPSVEYFDPIPVMLREPAWSNRRGAAEEIILAFSSTSHSIK